MKISIGTNIKEGPWGGGNLFAINLKKYLEHKGHVVTNDLKDKDIDVILITEPRKTSESSAFTQIDVLKYLSFVKKDTIVVHRINECDERKGTNYVNKYLINANKVSDATVFVSSWIKKLYSNQGLNHRNASVILSGANPEIFNKENLNIWDGLEKLKIVTHHWGGNWNKGFDTYKKLDNLLNENKWNDKFEFTYIGNLPKNFKFKNSHHISPLSGFTLASEIKKHHIYITGSINEPSGNHHIEAAQCGLPLLYINSGGIPEYCEGFGVQFELNNLEEKMDYLINNYENLLEKIKNYPRSAEKMSSEYEKLFLNLYENKSNVVNSRKINLIDSKLSKFKYNLFN